MPLTSACTWLLQVFIVRPSICQWQARVFLLALDYYTHTVECHRIDHLDGELPLSYRHDFTILTGLASRVDGSSKKQKSGISHTPALARKYANDSSILCILFNTGVFSRSNCHSKHACKNCKSKNHGSKTFNEASRALQIWNESLVWEPQAM